MTISSLTTTAGCRAGGATQPVPQPAGQRNQAASRGRHGNQYPPHNPRELADAVFWALENHDADERGDPGRGHGAVKADPTTGLIVRSGGTMMPTKLAAAPFECGVVEVEEDSRGRTSLVITSCHYQVNHDNFITSIAERVRDGKLAGISNIEDQSSDRVGLRIVIEIKARCGGQSGDQ